jgi:hypothetical protein
MPIGTETRNTSRASERVERERQRAEAEDRKANVVNADPAVDVAEPAQRHHEHGRHDHVAHQHPEQVADVARVSGLSLIHRKMAGSEMITMEELTVADSIPGVVLDSAIHL